MNIPTQPKEEGRMYLEEIELWTLTKKMTAIDNKSNNKQTSLIEMKCNQKHSIIKRRCKKEITLQNLQSKKDLDLTLVMCYLQLVLRYLTIFHLIEKLALKIR